jgi:hypothetical protein
MSANSAMTTEFAIEWVDHGREPKCAPDPAYPHGKDLDSSQGAPSCAVDLPYPAKRCGLYIVECAKCGVRIGITTAGRPDDPRSVRIACQAKFN